MSDTIRKLTELLDAATPGPWECLPLDGDEWFVVMQNHEDGWKSDSTCLSVENALLIVAAVNALPALIAVAKAADAACDIADEIPCWSMRQRFDDAMDDLRSALAALKENA